MLKKIFIGVGALAAVFVVVVAVQPSEYHVERSIEMNAPAEVVWAEVSDFHSWQAWNPWFEMDPDQKTTVTGEPGAVGHKNAWSGEKTGEGFQEIVKADAPKELGMKLVMQAPMADEASPGFKLEESENGTKVTWFIDGHNGFVKKFFALVMGMEDMLGTMFEDGLAAMKPIVEKKAKEQAEAVAAVDDVPEEGTESEDAASE